MQYASKTKVSPQTTLQEIERTVRRYGADSFAYIEEPGRVMVGCRLTRPRQLKVKFILPLTRRGNSGQDVPLDARCKPELQRIRQRWRALYLSIRSKLEVVESGIEEMEQAFFAEIILPSGKTIAEETLPQVREMLKSGIVRPLLLEMH
jgi:hypothetical protein